ncbi:MAG: pilin [Patescibacteria group bacterium]
MNKIFIQFLTFLIATSLLLGINSFAIAAEETKGASTPVTDLNEVLGKTPLSNFEGKIHQLSSVDPGADVITTIIFTAIDFMKYLIGAIAVIFITVSGIKLITSGKKIDEVSEKEKENLKFIIYGLILIITADELVTKVFFGDYGECVASASNAQECAKVGGSLVKGVYSLILAMMATVGIFVVVLSGFRLVTSTGDEEVIKKQKSRMTMAVVGLIVAALGEFVVKGIVFPEAGTQGIDVEAAKKLVYNFTNFVAAFIGASAFVMLFYGGYLYVMSFGNEEQTGKAKKIIVGAIVGMLIAFAAFGVVATVTSLNPGRTNINLPQNLPGLPNK